MKKYLLLSLSAILIAQGLTKTIQIMHWNDVSGQIEKFVPGTSNSSAAPTPCPPNVTTCVGGVVNLVNHMAKDSSNVDYSLRLSSGNLIGGESGWISVVGWKDYAKFIRDHFKPDVLALGMKEFGAGVSRTLEYMDAINIDENATEVNKIVLSNTCIEQSYPIETPEGKFCSKIQKVKVLSLGSDNIGVVGFVTPTVEQLSLPGKLKFRDPSDEIGRAIADSGQYNINTYIAIGDGNLDMAKKIIQQNSKVKLVIYGAGLSTTKDMSNEYPMKYQNSLIATAGRYGSTIGKLILDWNPTTGELTPGVGSQLYPTTIEPWGEDATKANTAYTVLESAVLEEKKMILGHSRVILHGGEKCWRHECNLGNLVTDAMVHCALMQPPIATPFPYPIHSIWHGGAFFEEAIKPGVSINKFDVHKWLPYHNRAHLVKISGSNLRRVFQLSAGGIDPAKAGVKDWRQFLQISNGMEVYYEYDGAPKLLEIRMTEDDDGVPKMTNMEDNKDYYLVIPTYLYEGRGVYEFAKEGVWTDIPTFENVTSNFAFDDDCVEGYVRAMWQISVGFEERIFINDESLSSTCQKRKGQKTAVTVVLTIVFFSIFIAIIYVGYFYVLPRLRRRPTEYPANQL